MAKLITACKVPLPAFEELWDLYYLLNQDTAQGMATREIRGETEELKYPSENHTSNVNVSGDICSTQFTQTIYLYGKDSQDNASILFLCI